MKITGYKLKELIKAKQLELATISTTFEESLSAFADETDKNPESVATAISKLERDISFLQTMQSKYNLAVPVTVSTKEKLTLEQAVKLVGGMGRIAKMWRNAAKGEKRDRYGYGSNAKTRKNDEEVAKPTIAKTKALELARTAEAYAGSLRNGIAVGNTTEIELDIPQELLS